VYYTLFIAVVSHENQGRSVKEKSKVILGLTKHHNNKHGAVQVTDTFVTSVLNGGERSASQPRPPFPREKGPGVRDV